MRLLLFQLLVDFAISDQAYAKAKVPVTDSVNLWLGANVMLEYPLEEAKALLVGLPQSLNLQAQSQTTAEKLQLP